MSDLSYELRLLQKLVSFNTDSQEKSNYEECSNFLFEEAKEIGTEAKIMDARQMAKDGLPRPSVILNVQVGSGKTVLLLTHYDVVKATGEWKHPPFKLTIEEEKAYGRGAADDKGSIAALYGAIKELSTEKLKYNLIAAMTPDEEVGGHLGAGFVAEKLADKVDLAIVLDSSPEYLGIGASGILWGSIKVRGKGGHAGYPFLADNPIKRAAELLVELNRYEKSLKLKTGDLPSPPSSPHRYIFPRFTVTMIKAWEKENIIPSTCELRFDRRLTPSEKVEEVKSEVKEEINRIADKKKLNVEVNFIKASNGYSTNPGHPLVQEVRRTIEKTINKRIDVACELGGNDGGHFARKGVPVVCYGTNRRGCNIHSQDEFVYLKDIKILKETIINLFIKR